jgi:hypothetical protein
MAAKQKTKKNFHHQLVLNRWMYRFFAGGSLQVLKNRLGLNGMEGVADDGQTHYYHQLNHNLLQMDRISQAELLRYDLHVVEYWHTITAERNHKEHTVMHLKYFQYLSLLFTEIYLDWYFNKRQQLLDELNVELAMYNQERDIPGDCFQPYELDDLNKLAFWNATGSGKTLLLHVNILQYLHYFQKGKANLYPDKIILLTPNEGLSNQHMKEFELSRMLSGHFDKYKASIPGSIDVIDINKLGDKMGEKTVAVEAFEGHNLVLVDEGHRGTSSSDGAWMARREVLSRNGFSFEYSATFGQAVAKEKSIKEAEEEAKKKKAKILFQTPISKLNETQKACLNLDSEERRRVRVSAIREAYAKCVLFDYSYKYFYDDGYGKESLILNLAKDDDVKLRRLYFTACLLSFYQQQYLYRLNQQKLKEFNIEKPLWVFVGNKVSDDDSDILAVLQFLASFVNDEEQSKVWIQELIEDKAPLLDLKGRNIFEGRFTPLMGKQSDWLFQDILRTLFNAEYRQRLKLVNLKGAKGELALRLGGAQPFGIINIGDDSTFFKLCAEQSEAPFDTESDDFGTAVFHTINDKNSEIHMLLGSRKFTEGWSSWRVSTMGLLNMGRGEGSQIIQLFGRGVRLKGKDYSLKRSTPGERPKGLHLEKLETLNIFGVRADYMAQFKEYLSEEGIPTSDEMLEIDFPTRNTVADKLLKTLALKDGYKDNQLKGFKRSRYPVLYEIPSEYVGKIKKPHVTLDLYPKLEALRSGEKQQATVIVYQKEQHKIPFSVMSMMDYDRIYLAVQNFKMQRNFSNLRLSKDALIRFCTTMNSWYTLHMSASDIEIRQFQDVYKMENILITLLENYTDRFYKALKNAYEDEFYEVVELTEDHPSMITMYQFQVEDSDEGLIYKERLDELGGLIREGRIGEANKWNANHMVSICFDRQLYYPLFYLNPDKHIPLKMRPIALDAPSEVTFVQNLEKMYNSAAGREWFGKRSVYLLRNADSKAKGLGFALAGNFYPDFLLWLVDDHTGEQWLSFLDPKGIRNLSLSDPKFGLYQEIKTLQSKLGDHKLYLNAFILSETKYEDLLNIKDEVTVQVLENQHVLFMDDPDYLIKMFTAMK